MRTKYPMSHQFFAVTFLADQTWVYFKEWGEHEGKLYPRTTVWAAKARLFDDRAEAERVAMDHDGDVYAIEWHDRVSFRLEEPTWWLAADVEDPELYAVFLRFYELAIPSDERLNT